MFDLCPEEIVSSIRVGDHVVSDYIWEEKSLVREVLEFRKGRFGEFGSGYGIVMSKGLDSTGNPTKGTEIRGYCCGSGLVDAAWAIPVSYAVMQEIMK